MFNLKFGRDVCGWWSQEDRHQWHQEVRVAEGAIRELAGRIGSVPLGGPLTRAVRQQRWSPLNVPIMWAAAGSSESTPVVDWLAQSSTSEPINSTKTICLRLRP